MDKTIFFDLEGTLWDPSHKLLEVAWQRLPQAVLKLYGREIPENFWKELAGDTELGVARKIVKALFPKRDYYDYAGEDRKLIALMDDYYLKHGPLNIKEALYSNTRKGLERLKGEGFSLGCVTGNSRAVFSHKINAAGLSDLFDNPSLIFTGEKRPSRHELLIDAYTADILRSWRIRGSETQPPLIYVADTLRDLEALKETRWSGLGFNLDMLVLLRWNPELSRIDLVGESKKRGFRVDFFLKSVGDETFFECLRQKGHLFERERSFGGKEIW